MIIEEEKAIESAKKARRSAMINALENIDIEKGLDLDVFMGNKYR